MRITVIDTVSEEHDDFAVLREFEKLRKAVPHQTIKPGNLVAFILTTDEGLSLRTGRVLDRCIVNYHAGWTIVDEDGTRNDAVWEQITKIEE